MVFSVTYEIMTPESAEHGDAEDRGYIAEGLRLREAMREVFGTRTSLCEGVSSVESSNSTPNDSRWFTVYNGIEFETGAYESRSIHIPENITASSRQRIYRLMRA